jgi:ubiquinone/menaquinone biosynthesis C-methylase UbiE
MMLAMELVRRAYGRMAKQYIDLFGTSSHMHEDDLALITRHLSIRPGTVLDVGCGPGHLTDHLRKLDVEVTGIDLVPEFIDHARLTFPDGRFEVGSMQQLPVVDGSVAGILAWYSLIHFAPTDIDGLLGELRRALAPGGVLVTGFFNGNELSAFDHSVATAYYWPIDELSARLERTGFTEIERLVRPGVNEPGRRPEAALVAIARS